MRFIDQLVAASALLAVVSASPIQKRGNKFSVQQQSNGPVVRNGPAALAKAYRKYKIDVPANLKAAADNDGSVTATPQSDDESYLCPVTIGGQTLTLDFDTGSADLWVFSSELSSSEQGSHTVYNPSDSSTAEKDSGATWSISYGDGSSASGNVYYDTVSVGDTTVDHQAVELAEQISSEFESDANSDGLLGLAFSSINTVSPGPENTFFDNAKSSLDSPLFTADLKHQAAGSYDFGYIDDSKYTGDITYTDVDSSNGFWEFTGTGYAIGDGSFVDDSIDAIMDTGTTLLLVPDDVVSAYYDQVDGASYDDSQGGYTFSCDASLPDITLGIGSYHAVVPGSYINYASVDSSNCFGGIQSNSGEQQAIYGDIFIKSQFVVFDSNGPQLGVAAKDL